MDINKKFFLLLKIIFYLFYLINLLKIFINKS